MGPPAVAGGPGRAGSPYEPRAVRPRSWPASPPNVSDKSPERDRSGSVRGDLHEIREGNTVSLQNLITADDFDGALPLQ